MRYLMALLLMSTFTFAKPPGEVIFQNSCERCHAEGSKKPLSYLRQKYRSNPQGIMELAKVCPWGKNLSDMEIELVSRWIAEGK
ncbi:MAG: cytochrome c [Acidobacteria bacterium]|nr:MAG: cytochrome c [Acidobacteriota bacterium]